MTDYSSLSDVQLIILLKDDNHMAFTELYRRYWAKLYLYASKLVKGNHDGATDIVQDVLSYIWDKRMGIEVKDSVSGYLYRSVRYQVIKLIRTEQVHDRFLSFFKDFYGNQYVNADQHLLEKELQQKIEAIITSMPPRMKEIFILSRYEELTRKLIAEKLNISVESVKAQINDALKILRKKINVK